MDFKQLEVFVSVAKNKSFSKAAKNLFLTQPTVSAHIQKLEKELSIHLFDRSNKIITLTPAGKILYENSLIILNNCKKALYDLNEYSGKIEGIIDIATSSIPETYVLPSFLKFFNDRYTDVKFNITHYNSQDAISEILDEKISFGFVGSKLNNSQIQYIDLIDDELVLLCPLELHIPNDNGYINIDTLNNLSFIMRKDGSGTKNLTLNLLKNHGFHPDNLNIIAYVESNESIKEMVRIGLGVSFISYNSSLDYIDSNKVKYYKIKNITFLRKFYFIYSKKKVFSPLEEKFLDVLREYFEKNRP